jgi:hypothetical protein
LSRFVQTSVRFAGSVVVGVDGSVVDVDVGTEGSVVEVDVGTDGRVVDVVDVVVDEVVVVVVVALGRVTCVRGCAELAAYRLGGFGGAIPRGGRTVLVVLVLVVLCTPEMTDVTVDCGIVTVVVVVGATGGTNAGVVQFPAPRRAA